MGLIDEIKTSDEYLLTLAKDHQVVKISFEQKPTFMEKLSDSFSAAITKAFTLIINKMTSENTVAK